MEGRKLRSRRATHLGVIPLKEAMETTKASVKKSSRKALVDTTNATPVAGLAPSPLKAVMRQSQEMSSPIPRGEDVLRCQVHKELDLVGTPANGLSAQSLHAQTPQFRIPLDEEAQIDAAIPSDEEATSPPRDIATTLKLSSEWVGRDVDDIAVCEIPAGDAEIEAPALQWQQRRTSPKARKAEEVACDDDDAEDYEDYEDVELGGEDYCDDLCRAVSQISVAEDGVARGLPEHTGRHVRFNYNSEDEIEEEEVEVMRLKGLPTPKGKHLRFSEDNE